MGTACEGMLPAVPEEDAMEDVGGQLPATKAARKVGDQDRRMSAARASALERGDDMDDDEEEEAEDEGGPWTQVGPHSAIEKLRRQLQCSHDHELAQRVNQRRLKARKASGAKAQAQGSEASATGQPSQAPTTPQASLWDSSSWSSRLRGTPAEDNVHFPPLQAKDASRAGAGTPAQAIVTGSITRQPSVGGSTSSGANPTQPPAQGTGSATEPSSAGGPAGSVPPAPPAQGPGNGGGDGTAA